MTRIVAGRAGGRSLAVPPKGTRPTSDRVREAIFSRLEHYGAIDGARVLDLYAGSGALGLEAASRGAAEVTLVDVSRQAAQVCATNVTALGLDGVRVVTDKAARVAATAPTHPWDLVFLDPPYDVADAEVAEVLAALEPHVSTRCVVVVERSARSPEPRWPSSWSRIAAKTYGDTAVHYAEVAVVDEPADQAGAGGDPGLP